MVEHGWQWVKMAGVSKKNMPGPEICSQDFHRFPRGTKDDRRTRKSKIKRWHTLSASLWRSRRWPRWRRLPKHVHICLQCGSMCCGLGKSKSEASASGWNWRRIDNTSFFKYVYTFLNIWYLCVYLCILMYAYIYIYIYRSGSDTGSSLETHPTQAPQGSSGEERRASIL